MFDIVTGFITLGDRTKTLYGSTVVTIEGVSPYLVGVIYLTGIGSGMSDATSTYMPFLVKYTLLEVLAGVFSC